MRKSFADALYREMKLNEDIWVLCGDVGYGVMDHIVADFPKRAFNVGAREQAMIDICVGLALEGKIPFAYTITPFLLYRPFESVRLYLNMEKIPVKLVGSGRDRDYYYIGITHFSEDDKKIMSVLPNIKSYWPVNSDNMDKLVKEVIGNNKPSYINLTR